MEDALEQLQTRESSVSSLTRRESWRIYDDYSLGILVFTELPLYDDTVCRIEV